MLQGPVLLCASDRALFKRHEAIIR